MGDNGTDTPNHEGDNIPKPGTDAFQEYINSLEEGTPEYKRALHLQAQHVVSETGRAEALMNAERSQRQFRKQEQRIANLEAEKQRLRYEKNQAEDRARRLGRELKAREDYEPDDETHSQLLIKIAREDASLFVDEKGDAYATFRVPGGEDSPDWYPTARLDSSEFSEWWRYRFFDVKGKPPSNQAVQDAKNHLRSQARYEGETRTVHVRVAKQEGNIYIDLADDTWRAVKVTPRSWSIVRNPPVKFRRPKGMKALPDPVRGGGLGLLQQHINVRSDADFALLCGWLVQAFNPAGPYPVLPIVGEHGSGKTWVQKVLRSLVDPSHVPTRTAPNQEQDLVIAADNEWVLAFDNISSIQPWLSDALCRLATGGGFGTRKLYEDREQELFFAMRPILLNGIEDLTTRPDLADRSVVLHLESIPDEKRKTERQMSHALERDRPKIFGAILDALVTALERFDDVDLESLPRMADFAMWAKAAEPAFPVEEGTFMDAYTENRSEASETALEADPVASAVRNLLEHKKSKPSGKAAWIGTMKELLEDLRGHVPNPDRPPSGFPSSHQSLTSQLRRVMPVLRDAGVRRVDTEAKRDRRFKLVLDDDEAPF
jgi:hypothetical protein